MEPIIVKSINATKNAEVFMLELRSDIKKPVEQNLRGFLLQGLPNVGDGLEHRVAFEPISKHQINALGIKVGTDLTSVMEAKLVVKESFEPRTWTNADGTLGEQKSKVNPSTGEILKQNGKAIYRNCYLSTLADEDKYLAHDKATAGQVQKGQFA
jgi:hypothetical protein